MYKDLDINELEKLKKEEAMLSLRKATTNIKERFGQSNYDILDEEFKSKTIGLVTREEFKRKRENIDRIYVQDLKIKQEEEEKKKLELKQKRKQEYKLKTTLLSFDQEQQEMNEKRNYGKDISVDTLYLPDMNREKKIEELTKIFTGMHQMNIRKIWSFKRINLLTLYFSIGMLKLVLSNFSFRISNECEFSILELQESEKIHQLKNFWNWQEKRLQEISDLYESNTQFIQLTEFSPDDLLFVANAMILPHKLSFHEIIAYKVKNRSGKPIFSFEQRKVQAKGNEYEVEVENSTTCRIIEKFRYEKIKHIYPCSKWEVVDINKYDDQRYICNYTNENYDE